jgi:hypothetical protein
MNWPAIISIFAAGFGAGCSFGVFMMASIRVGARYDRETETMLDNSECSGFVVHDFTGGSRPRVF